MAKPKSAPAAPITTSVYVVLWCQGVDSVHATLQSAEARMILADGEGKDALRIDVQELFGGTVNIDSEREAAEPAQPAKATKATKKPAKSEEEPAAEPKKKTKPVSEQRADNAAKPKKGKVDGEVLPDEVKALLATKGDLLRGKNVVVTGIPPVMGRKNAEQLVQNFGAKLMKSLSKNTDFVVVGNEAGPAKLEKIDELGLETLDEDGLIEMLSGDTNSNPAKKRKL